MIDRSTYILREIAALPRGTTVTRTEDGFMIQGIPYVALRCHCGHFGCDGWARVRDDEGARAQFERLFGKPRAMVAR